ncbi:MAG: ABC transporter ATP-binding protein [Actinobacteria bacterium]|nr:ABC transporter ATP-binding protein [Actinomycetota bacterium]
MLEIKGLNAYYGHIKAVKDFSLRVKKGEIIAILGPNGAGKTTLIRSIGGFSPPYTEGEIIFNGKNITRLKPFERLGLGIAVLLEGKRVFPGLSVADNLFIGGYTLRRRKKELKENIESVLELFPVLRERLNKRASVLSGGEQQMLAIARALISSPEILCLDEPSFGLGPKVVEAIFKTLDYLRKERGLSIVLVEQDAALALKFSDYSILMVSGSKKIEGRSKELINDKRLLNIYLGG